MTPDSNIVKRAKKVVDAGMNIPLAQLTESIQTNEKLDALLAKESIEIPPFPEFPELPEYPTEISISNLPEVQKVEITNLPNEKDDKEVKNLLKELVAEVKKKEQYAYDIEIDPTLKEELRGEDGIDGKTPVKGEDYFTEQDKKELLDLLSKKEPIVIDNIKGLRQVLESLSTNHGKTFDYLRNLVDVSATSATEGQILTYNASTQKWVNTNLSTQGLLTYMFSSINSDIAGYESMPALTSYTAGALTTITTNVTTTATLIGTFATNLGSPNVTSIPVGIFSAHIETQKATGGNFYNVYYEMYKRSSGGVETLLVTSDTSSDSSSNGIISHMLSAFITSEITLLSTDRLVIKIYARMLNNNNDITLRYDDNTNSRVELPITLPYVTNTGFSISLISNDYVLPTAQGQYLIECNCANNNINLTLPSPTANIYYTIRKKDSTSNYVNLIGTINYEINKQIAFQNTSINLISSAASWVIV